MCVRAIFLAGGGIRKNSIILLVLIFFWNVHSLFWCINKGNSREGNSFLSERMKRRASFLFRLYLWCVFFYVAEIYNLFCCSKRSLWKERIQLAVKLLPPPKYGTNFWKSYFGCVLKRFLFWIKCWRLMLFMLSTGISTDLALKIEQNMLLQKYTYKNRWKNS